MLSRVIGIDRRSPVPRSRDFGYRHVSPWPDPAVPALRHFFTPDPFWRTLVGNGIAMGESLPATWKKACQDAFSARPANGDLNVREVAMFNCPSPVRTFLERVNCMA